MLADGAVSVSSELVALSAYAVSLLHYLISFTERIIPSLLTDINLALSLCKTPNKTASETQDEETLKKGKKNRCVGY